MAKTQMIKVGDYVCLALLEDKKIRNYHLIWIKMVLGIYNIFLI